MKLFNGKIKILCSALLIFNVILLCLIITIALAQEVKPSPAPSSSEVIIISHMLDLEFIADEAFFLIEMESSLRKVKAVLVPPFGQDEKNAAGGKWQLGAFLQVPPNLTKLKYSVLARGADKHVKFVPNVIWELSTQNTFSGSIDLLKGYLNQRRQVLRSWQTQVRVQEESLRRLRADADAIAQVSRIVEVKEEIDLIKSEINSLTRDAEVMNEFLKQVKNQSQPNNFTRREIDLTKQITELVQVVKMAESGEGVRRKQTQSELDRKLALMEETRLDDEEGLKSELSALRARRLKLEESNLNGGNTGGNPSYWDVQ